MKRDTRTAENVTGHVVVGVDGSEHATRALDWAADLAALEHRHLTVLSSEDPIGSTYVTALGGGYAPIDWTEVRGDARRARESFLSAAQARSLARHPGLEVRTVCGEADPRTALLEAGSTAHLLVVGSRGRGPLARLTLGSVSSAVVRHSDAPVAVVGSAGAEDQAEQGAEGTVGLLTASGAVRAVVDLSVPSVPILEAAAALASTTGRALVVQPVGWREGLLDVDDDLRRLLAEATAGLDEKYPDVDISLDVAGAVRSHPTWSEMHPDDLVVAGRHDKHLHLRPPTYLTVLDHAPCPVLVVPTST